MGFLHTLKGLPAESRPWPVLAPFFWLFRDRPLTGPTLTGPVAVGTFDVALFNCHLLSIFRRYTSFPSLI